MMSDLKLLQIANKHSFDTIALELLVGGGGRGGQMSLRRGGGYTMMK